MTDSPPMSDRPQCPQCGAVLIQGTLAGLCPACLLAVGAEPGSQPHPGPAFEPPGVADLTKLFPHLEITELIGKGGMGAVYKARQRELDRPVALKILPANPQGGPAFAERFNREARALARLTHPNIVSVYESGQAGDWLYFVMEFVDGVNLRQLQRTQKLSPREALQIIPQLCDALQYAHDQGIVHRDIKPENVLIDRRGRIKIADFGLAKILGVQTAAAHLTLEGERMGTPHYMAPEQVERPASVDHRADIYSLGVVFYELLTGELPLGRFEPPSHKVELDVRLDEVVLRTLEKAPDRRYQRASQVKDEVETIASGATDPSLPKEAAQTAPPPASFLWYLTHPFQTPEIERLHGNTTPAEKRRSLIRGWLLAAAILAPTLWIACRVLFSEAYSFTKVSFIASLGFGFVYLATSSYRNRHKRYFLFNTAPASEPPKPALYSASPAAQRGKHGIALALAVPLIFLLVGIALVLARQRRNAGGMFKPRLRMPDRSAAANLGEESIPQLKYLAWGSSNWAANAWLADGSSVSAEDDLQTLRTLETNPSIQSLGASPAGLMISFYLPGFDQTSFASLTVENGGNYGCNGCDGCTNGWMIFALFPQAVKDLPSPLKLRLEYATGAWHEAGVINPLDSGLIAVGGVGHVTGMGQTAKGKTSVSITFDGPSASDQQYSLVAITKDGQEISSQRGTSSRSAGVRIQQFEFDSFIDEIDRFLIRSRPLYSMNYERVDLHPFPQAAIPAPPKSEPEPVKIEDTRVDSSSDTGAKLEYLAWGDENLEPGKVHAWRPNGDPVVEAGSLSLIDSLTPRVRASGNRVLLLYLNAPDCDDDSLATAMIADQNGWAINPRFPWPPRFHEHYDIRQGPKKPGWSVAQLHVQWDANSPKTAKIRLFYDSGRWRDTPIPDDGYHGTLVLGQDLTACIGRTSKYRPFLQLSASKYLAERFDYDLYATGKEGEFVASSNSCDFDRHLTMRVEAVFEPMPVTIGQFHVRTRRLNTLQLNEVAIRESGIAAP